MARLFVAIGLSDAARRAIAAEQQRIVGAVERSGAVRCVAPDHMHVTLAFIGEVAGARAAAIVKASSEPLAAAPFDVAFGVVGVCPPRGAPRVRWLGITSGADDVGAVRRLVAARLEAIGVVLERKPFHPHLTLARWRRGSLGGRPIAVHGEGPIVRLAVVEVTLFQSRLSCSGSAYTALARAPLAAVLGSPL